MANDKETLALKIVELCSANWVNSAKPLLLSQLGSSLTSAGIDYKSILKLQGLRQFIESEIDDLAIVQHPIQYAKVGVIPVAEDFSYDEPLLESKSEMSDADRLRKSRRAFYGFIEAISELPPEEIEEVSIPARVIVRLLEGK